MVAFYLGHLPQIVKTADQTIHPFTLVLSSLHLFPVKFKNDFKIFALIWTAFHEQAPHYPFSF